MSGEFAAGAAAGESAAGDVEGTATGSPAAGAVELSADGAGAAGVGAACGTVGDGTVAAGAGAAGATVGDGVGAAGAGAACGTVEGAVVCARTGAGRARTAATMAATTAWYVRRLKVIECSILSAFQILAQQGHSAGRKRGLARLPARSLRSERLRSHMTMPVTAKMVGKIPVRVTTMAHTVPL